MVIQRVAAADQAVARAGGAVAECAADALGRQRAVGHRVGEHVRVTQNHPPQSDNIDPPFADEALRHVRQKILQVAVGAPGNGEVGGCRLAELSDDLNLPLNINKRIVRRLVTVRRRIGGGTLDVRVVIRRTGAEADQFDPQVGAQFHELLRLREIHLQRVGGIQPEPIMVRKAVGEIVRDAGAKFARLRPGWISPERHEVERAHSNDHLNVVPVGADAVDYLAQDAGAVLKRAAVPAGPRAGAEKFVQQIAVTMLEVDEVRPRPGGEPSGADVVADKTGDLVVGPYLVVAGNVKFRVEDWMPIGDSRLEFGFLVGTAEASRVRELKANRQVIG